MTDVLPDRRDTGDPVVCVKSNGSVTWKWLVGAIMATVISAGGVYVRSAVATARLEERFKAHQREAELRNTLQDGLNSRFDRGFKDLNKYLQSFELRQVRIEERIVPARFRVPPVKLDNDGD
ncbi:MAG: hypothetical protein ACXADY_25215 [Candidatus Hodarchaeales archaeon]|jgi:hypothetical protein